MTPGKSAVARAIEEYEYLRHSAGGLLCGVYVRATSVRIFSGKATANVTVTEPDGTRTRYPGCEYDLAKLPIPAGPEKPAG